MLYDINYLLCKLTNETNIPNITFRIETGFIALTVLELDDRIAVRDAMKRRLCLFSQN